MKIVDLHTHTAASDGTYPPSELVNYAIEKGLSALAITDHDTMLGVLKARKYMSENRIENLELISGIEFSTTIENIKAEIHIVGLFVDETNEKFIAEINKILNGRTVRNERLVARLNELGIKIELQEVLEAAKDKVITRAHFAKLMLEKGYVKTHREAFDKYLAYDGPAFIKREKLTTYRAIEIVNNCGGVPILAHPFLYGLDNEGIDELVKDLKDHGLKGIEAKYALHTPEEELYITELAAKYNLAISGGSDFHGAHRSHVDLAVGQGKLTVPYELLEKLRNL